MKRKTCKTCRFHGHNGRWCILWEPLMCEWYPRNLTDAWQPKPNLTKRNIPAASGGKVER